MGNSITEASVKVGVDGTSVPADTAKITNEIDKWTKAVNQKLSSAGHASNIGIGMAQGIGQALTNGLGGIIGKVYQEIWAPFERAKNVKNLSDITGLSPELLSSMEYGAKSAGVEFETATKSLIHFTDEVAKARAFPNKENIFNKLGIDTSGSNDEVLKRTADAIMKIDDAATRTSYEMEIFGAKSMKAMAVLLQGGGAGLDKLVADMTHLGVALSAADLTQLIKADQAMDRFKASWDGLITRLAIEGAPVIEQLADLLKDALPNAIPYIQEFGNEFKKIFADILEGVAEVIDAIGKIKTDMGNAKTKTAEIGNLLFGDLSVYAHKPGEKAPIELQEHIDEGAKATEAANRIREAAKNIKATIKDLNNPEYAFKSDDELFHTGDKGETKRTVELTSAINEQIKAVKKQIDTFGMSGDEIKLWELKQEGATDAMLDGLRQKQQQLAAMKVPTQVKLSNAEMAGSTEASNFILSYRGQAGNGQQQMLDIMTKQENAAQRAANDLSGIRKKLDEGPVLGVI